MNTPIYADLDQIVFEGREQNYGAYHMRKRYNRILTRASLIAFLLFISITALPKMVNWIMPKIAEEVTNEPELMLTTLEVPIAPKDPVEPIELPAQPSAPLVRTVDMSVPTPTPAEQLQDEELVAEITDADSAAIGTDTHDGDPSDGYDWTKLNNNPCPTCPPTDLETVVLLPQDTIPDINGFVLLEKEPKPVNLDELKGLIGYPPMAVEGEIEGKVIVRVLIDKHGDYKSHKVLKDAHPILNKAVNDKIHLLKMTPGIQAGKPISVWVTLPFNFELNN